MQAELERYMAHAIGHKPHGRMKALFLTRSPFLQSTTLPPHSGHTPVVLPARL